MKKIITRKPYKSGNYNNNRICFNVVAELALLILLSLNTLSQAENTGPLSLGNNGFLSPLYLNLQMEEARTLNKGKFKLSLSSTFVSGDYKGTSSGNIYQVNSDAEFVRTTLSLSYGVTERLETGIKVPFLGWDGNLGVQHNGINWFAGKNINSGLSEIIVNLKYAWLKEKNSSLGLSSNILVKTPSGDKGNYLGDGETEYGFNNILSYYAKRFNLHLNLGYTFLGEVDCFAERVKLDDILFYGLALNIPLPKNFALVTQVYGSQKPFPRTGVDVMDDAPLEMGSGIKWEKNGFELQLAGAVGLSDSSPDSVVLLSLSRIF